MGSLIRYLKGYLKIRVRGYAPERFMNLCSTHRILLWDISRQEDGYIMYISLSGFFRLRPIVRKTGTRAAVLERYGLPFLIQKMRKRKVFALGLPCCLAFLLAMSRFVWAVDFEGNHQVTDDLLMRFLTEEGVDFGIPKNRVDVQLLESELRERFDCITWTSVRMEGTRLLIQIKENDLDTAEDTAKNGTEEAGISTDAEKQEGWDLKAEDDGVVLSVLVRRGVPLVKAGDTVHAGDIMVTGAVPVMQDDGTVKNYQYCRADADVELLYEEKIYEKQPLCYEYKSYTGREKRKYLLKVGNKSLVVGLSFAGFSCQDTVTAQKQLCLPGQFCLPVSWGIVTYREYLPVEALYQLEQAERMLKERLEKRLDAIRDEGGRIIRQDVRISREEKLLILEGSLQIQGKNGIPARTLIRESETQTAPESES